MNIKSLYIASLEPQAGSLIVTMGIMEILKRKLGKVAFFRPVIEKGVDEDILFILEHFALDQAYDTAFGLYVEEAEAMIAQNRRGELVEAVMRKFKELEGAYDFILCEGLHRSAFSSAIEFDINIELAKNLSASFVSVLKGKDKNIREITEEIAIEAESIRSEGCDHFATFVNRVSTEIRTELLAGKLPASGGIPVYLLHEAEELDMPTAGEVLENLQCELIFGTVYDLGRVVRQSKIAAMTLEHFLPRIQNGDLIIVPGDREEIILGTLAANYSKDFPTIAGILVTGGIQPGNAVMRLLDGLKLYSLPIMTTHYDTYTTAMLVNGVPARLTAKNSRKIALAQGIFSSSVAAGSIEERIIKPVSQTVTPIMFEYNLFERARSSRKTIVLPESEDARILRAAEILLRRDVVDIILLGNPDEIRYRSSSMGLDLAKARLIDPLTSELTQTFAGEFYTMRQHKGIKYEEALEAMQQVSYFGTMLVHSGMADGMVSGASHTTQETIRPALQIIKTKPGISIVSSIFFMCLETRVLVYGDCAVNLDPDAKELAEIAISSADTARVFGIEPKAALLSYSTGDSGQGEDVEKVREATKIAKTQRPDLDLEGPIQYDAAIDKEVAEKKLPGSKVAGAATVLIFPDLNTGNNTYKAVQRSSGAVAIGPVLQGLNKPINDLSRGCLVEDIVNTVSITAIQAQENDKDRK